MPSFQNTRAVRHSAHDMFALVADVENYPQFVPMCERLEVVKRSESEDGATMLVANMAIGYKMIHERFKSRVRLDEAKHEIFVEYIDGPFRYLENRWRFEDKPHGCEVTFFIDYEFKSRTFGILAGAVFDAVFRRMVQAFETRADAIYPRSP